MGFNDLINKGLNLVNKGANGLKNAAIDKKNSMQEYNLLITASDHLENMLPYEVKNPNTSIGREQMILASCLTINVEKSKLINSLIPLEDTVVIVRSAKESKTELEYFFIVTDKCLWVANAKEYRTYDFSEIKGCKIINKNIMTQGVNFNEKAFLFDGTEKDVQAFCDILTNENIRKESIIRATSYLCGVTPKEQYINMYGAGLTIGINGELVFHNGKFGNKKTTAQNINSMQLLMDNTVVMSKGRPNTQSILSSQVDARKISVKVVMNDENFIMDVMPQNILGTIVKKEDETYQRECAFAKSIINKVNDMLK